MDKNHRFSIHLHDCKEFFSHDKFIQSAQFDGKGMQVPWFSHEDLLNGGTLSLVMGPKPNKALWKNADAGFLYP